MSFQWHLSKYPSHGLYLNWQQDLGCTPSLEVFSMSCPHKLCGWTRVKTNKANDWFDFSSQKVDRELKNSWLKNIVQHDDGLMATIAERRFGDLKPRLFHKIWFVPLKDKSFFIQDLIWDWELPEPTAPWTTVSFPIGKERDKFFKTSPSLKLHESIFLCAGSACQEKLAPSKSIACELGEQYCMLPNPDLILLYAGPKKLYSVSQDSVLVLQRKTLAHEPSVRCLIFNNLSLRANRTIVATSWNRELMQQEIINPVKKT